MADVVKSMNASCVATVKSASATDATNATDAVDALEAKLNKLSLHKAHKPWACETVLELSTTDGETFEIDKELDGWPRVKRPIHLPQDLKSIKCSAPLCTELPDMKDLLALCVEKSTTLRKVISSGCNVVVCRNRFLKELMAHAQDADGDLFTEPYWKGRHQSVCNFSRDDNVIYVNVERKDNYAAVGTSAQNAGVVFPHVVCTLSNKTFFTCTLVRLSETLAVVVFGEVDAKIKGDYAELKVTGSHPRHFIPTGDEAYALWFANMLSCPWVLKGRHRHMQLQQIQLFKVDDLVSLEQKKRALDAVCAQLKEFFVNTPVTWCQGVATYA